ncbi:Plectin [Trichinella patagoniensis]|uniref:Plectin n=1 Tax=Trichinella patagoniensis TaxID=990121 RepID=A0A0V1A454_9BILA|nr:Plectin [Trichinella patagoniensis]
MLTDTLTLIYQTEKLPLNLSLHWMLQLKLFYELISHDIAGNFIEKLYDNSTIEDHFQENDEKNRTLSVQNILFLDERSGQLCQATIGKWFLNERFSRCSTLNTACSNQRQYCGVNFNLRKSYELKLSKLAPSQSIIYFRRANVSFSPFQGQIQNSPVLYFVEYNVALSYFSPMYKECSFLSGRFRKALCKCSPNVTLVTNVAVSIGCAVHSGCLCSSRAVALSFDASFGRALVASFDRRSGCRLWPSSERSGNDERLNGSRLWCKVVTRMFYSNVCSLYMAAYEYWGPQPLSWLCRVCVRPTARRPVRARLVFRLDALRAFASPVASASSRTYRFFSTKSGADILRTHFRRNRLVDMTYRGRGNAFFQMSTSSSPNKNMQANDDSDSEEVTAEMISKESGSTEEESMQSVLATAKAERANIQKKAFTVWMNRLLESRSKKVNDLFVDLKDGILLLNVLELLTGKQLKPDQGLLRIHHVQNVSKVLNFLIEENVKLVNMRPEHIVDGNEKLILGLVWVIILHFQLNIGCGVVVILWFIKLKNWSWPVIIMVLAYGTGVDGSSVLAREQSDDTVRFFCHDHHRSQQQQHYHYYLLRQTDACCLLVECVWLSLYNCALFLIGFLLLFGLSAHLMYKILKSYHRKAERKHEVTCEPLTLSPQSRVAGHQQQHQQQRSTSSTVIGGGSNDSHHHHHGNGKNGSGSLLVAAQPSSGADWRAGSGATAPQILTGGGAGGGGGYSESSSYETHAHYERKVQRVKKTRSDRDRSSNRRSTDRRLVKVSEPWHEVERRGGFTAKEGLLNWVQDVTSGYSGVNVQNFTTSWRDGLAFNAILHRFRPDLVKWSEVLHRMKPRERLENAFELFEKEFQVSRLLDPEDVDVSHPEEKSLTVYISMLYNALSNLEMPNFQDEVMRYRLSAREFSSWLQRAINSYQNTSAHPSERLLAEIDEFRKEEMRNKHREKERLEKEYADLEEKLSNIDVFSVEHEFTPGRLNRLWEDLLDALAARERALGGDVRVDLDELARNLNLQIGITNEKLDELLQQIEAADNNTSHDSVDLIVDGLNALESPIEGFFHDVDVLRSCNHPQANDFYRQVFGLHQRRIAYLQRCQGCLQLLDSSYVSRTERERLCRNKTQIFTQVCDYIQWVEQRIKELSELEFSEKLSDLDSMLEKHKLDHAEIMDFRTTVEQCIARQADIPAEDTDEYCNYLSKLEGDYSQLKKLSTGRMLDLDMLTAFVRAAQLELMWIQEREVIEVTRNWSDFVNLDLSMLQNYYKQLMHEIELREAQFNDVHDQGAALLNQRHPAVEVIELYVGMMQAQWDWLLGLTQCLEVHLQDSLNLSRFLEDVSNCENWFECEIQVLTELSNRRFNYLNLDECESMLAQLKEMRAMMDRYSETLISLSERSRTLSPLWQRGERITTTILVTALCNYLEKDIVVHKDDECVLIDNSDLVRWRVQFHGGVEFEAPSVIFRIPPPDTRVAVCLQRLQMLFDRMRRLWLENFHSIRFMAISDSLRKVRSWDLKQFLELDPASRDGLVSALNNDANELLAELDEDDPLSVQLRDELNAANEHFYRLIKLAQREPDPDVVENFDRKAKTLLQKLDSSWKTLMQRIADPIPRTADEWDKATDEHKAHGLQALDSEMSMIQELFRQILDPSPMQRALLEQVLSRWENLWETSKMHAESIKAVEAVLTGIVEANEILNAHERTLCLYDYMPSNLDQLRNMHAELLSVQMLLQQQQAVFDDLSSNVGKLRQHVARTRFNVADHYDINNADDDVQELTVRWENICYQVIDRLNLIESATGVLMQYQSAYENENAWLERVEKTIDDLRIDESINPEEYQKHLDLLMAEYRNLTERTEAVEHVNREGGRFIREAKTYDSRISQYRDSIMERNPTLSFGSYSSMSGHRQVAKDLEDFNRRFSQLASVILERRNVIQVWMQSYRRRREEEERQKRAQDEAARRAEEEARRRAEEEAERLRRLKEEEERRRRAAEEEAERLRRLREQEEARRAAEEARRRAEEEARRLAEAEARRRAEEEARRRADEEARRRAEEEARRRAEEEARRRAEEEARRRAEAEARRRAEEEARRRAEEEARRRAEEEEARRKAQEAALRRAAEEAERLRLQRAREDELRRAEEEARRRAKQAEEEAAARLRAEEEARRRAEEEARRRAEAEAAQRRADAEARRRADEEARRRADDEARRRADEEARRRADEEARRRAEEEARRRAEEEARRRAEEEARRRQLPKLDIKTGRQFGEAMEWGEAGELEETGDLAGVVKVSEHEDDMIMYAEETEIRTKFFELEAVKHLQTGEILTFVEAARQGVLDLKSGEFFDVTSGSRMSLEEAVRRGFVSQSLTECLNSEYGIHDPETRESITLMEAIRRGIYDPELRQLKNPRTGELLSLFDASTLGVITMDNVHRLIKMGILKLPPLHLQQAIEQAVIDLQTGTFIGRFSRETLPLTEALRNGYVTLSPTTQPGIGIALTECIEQRFIDANTGVFDDRVTGEKISLRDAVSKKTGLVNLHYREVVNTAERRRVTVEDALFRNVLNTRLGNYTDTQHRQTISLSEAYERELIQQPLTLFDVNARGLIDSTGRFVDAGTKRRMVLLEAIADGLLEPDVPHIVDSDEGDVVSIAVALERGLLTPTGEYVQHDPLRTISIQEAVNKSLIVSPLRYSFFDIKGIKDTKANRTLSFNEALDAGVIVLSSRRLVDTATNDSYMLDEIPQDCSIVDSAVLSVLNRPSGLIKKDHHHQSSRSASATATAELTVLEAVARGVIDSKKAVLLNSRQQHFSPRQAYESGLISLRGALLMSALFNVHPGLVMPSGGASGKSSRSSARKRTPRRARDFAAQPGLKMTLAEALHQGLVDPLKQTVVEDGREMTLQQAVDFGFIDTSTQWIVPDQGNKGPTIQESQSEEVTETSQVLAPKDTTDKHVEETVTTVKRQRITETTAVGGGAGSGVSAYRAITSRGQGGRLVVPVEGMHIYDAQRKGLLDLNTGMLTVPDVDRKLTFEEAIDLGIVNSGHLQVRGGRRGALNAAEAIEQGLLDPTGFHVDPLTKERRSLQAAIDADLVLVEPESLPDTRQSTKVIQFGLGASRGGAVLSFNPTGTSTREESELGWSFNSTTGEVVDEQTGERFSLDEALRRGKVAEEDFRVVDALTERELTFSDAEKWGVIESTSKMYVNKRDARVCSLQEAAKQGLLFYVLGMPQYARDTVETRVRRQSRRVVSNKESALAGPAAFVDYSLQKVIDLGWYDSTSGLFTHPDTKKQMSLRQAIIRGLFNPYECSIRHPATGERMALLDAIQVGLIDADRGLVVDSRSGRTYDLRQACQEGIICSGVVPQSLEAAIACGRLDLSAGTVSFPDGRTALSLHDAVASGVIDPASIRVLDPASGREMSFAEAVAERVVNLSRGLVLNKSTGEASSLIQAIRSGTLKPVASADTRRYSSSAAGSQEQQLLATSGTFFGSLTTAGGDVAKTSVMVKVIRDEQGVEKGEYVDPETKMKFTIQLHGDPYTTRAQTSVKSTAQVQSVELSPFVELVGIDKVLDKRTGRVMTLAEAQRAGLASVDRKGKQLTKSYAVFRSDLAHALAKGVVDPTTGERLSLEDAIKSRLIDIGSLVLWHPDSSSMDLAQAANVGLIDVTLAEVLPKGVCHPVSGERISTKRAIELKIINARTGEVCNPYSNERLTWLSIVKPVYASLVMEGVYDPRKGYAVPLSRALIEGLIDARARTYCNPITGEVLSLEEASGHGLVDEGTYKLILQPLIRDYRRTAAGEEMLCLLDAVRVGLVDPHARTVVVDRGATVPIANAVREGKFPRELGRLMRRVDKWTFAEALGQGLIDVAANQFTDPDSGQKLTIAAALQQGYIDTGSVEALEGADERNLSNVLESDEFDEHSGRIRDRRTGLYLTFKQAIERGIIDGDSLIYDVTAGRALTLNEALLKGRIDNSGKFVDSKTAARVSLKDAARVGLLALIASPMLAGQAAAEAIKRREAEGYRFAVEPSRFFDELRRQNLKPSEWEVFNPATGQSQTLEDAVESGLLDLVSGELIDPNSGQHYSIPKAVHLRWLSPATGNAMMASLNKIIEQRTGERPDISTAATPGLLVYTREVSWRGQPSELRASDGDLPITGEGMKNKIDAWINEAEQMVIVFKQIHDKTIEQISQQQLTSDGLKPLSEFIWNAKFELSGMIAKAERLETSSKTFQVDCAHYLSPDGFHKLQSLQDQLAQQASFSTKLIVLIEKIDQARLVLTDAIFKSEQFSVWLTAVQSMIEKVENDADLLREMRTQIEQEYTKANAVMLPELQTLIGNEAFCNSVCNCMIVETNVLRRLADPSSSSIDYSIRVGDINSGILKEKFNSTLQHLKVLCDTVTVVADRAPFSPVFLGTEDNSVAENVDYRSTTDGVKADETNNSGLKDDDNSCSSTDDASTALSVSEERNDDSLIVELVHSRNELERDLNLVNGRRRINSVDSRIESATAQMDYIEQELDSICRLMFERSAGVVHRLLMSLQNQMVTLNKDVEFITAQSSDIVQCCSSAASGYLQLKLDNLIRRQSNLKGKFDDVSNFVIESERQVKQAISESLVWTKQMFDQLSEFDNVSPLQNELKKQISAYDEFYNDVLAKQAEFASIIARGKKLIVSEEEANVFGQSCGTEVGELESALENLLQKSRQKARHFNDSLDLVISVDRLERRLMGKVEDWENEIQLLSSTGDAKLENTHHSLTELQHQMDCEKMNLTQLKLLTERLIETTSTDHQQQMNDRCNVVFERFEMVRASCLEKLHAVEQCRQVVSKFDSLLAEANESYADFNARLTALQDEQKSSRCDLAALREIARESHDLFTQKLAELKRLCSPSVGRDLPIPHARQAKMVEQFQQKSISFENCVRNYMNKLQHVENHCATVDSAVKSALEILEEVEKALSTEQEIDSTDGTSTIITGTGCEVLTVKKANSLERSLSASKQKVEDCIRKCCGPLRQMHFDKDADNCQKLIDQTLARLQLTGKNLEEKCKSLQQLVSEGKDVRQQLIKHLRLLKHLCSDALLNSKAAVPYDMEEIENLLLKIQETKHNSESVTSSALAIVDSSMPYMSNAVLETSMKEELETLTQALRRRVKDFSNRIESKEKQLEEARSSLTNFLENLKNMEEWLRNTELLIRDQKVFSSNPVVIESQLREQELLRKLLDDKSLFWEEISKACSPPAGSKLARDVQDIDRRFSDMKNDQESRMSILKDAFEIACIWNNYFTVLADWLQATEARVNDIGYVTTDEDSITKQFEKLKVLEKEFEESGNHLEKVMHFGQQFQDLLCDSEAAIVGEQMSSHSNRYQKLYSTVENLSELLSEMQQGVLSLTERIDDVDSWLNDLAERLNSVPPIDDIQVDVLSKQSQQIMCVAEEISRFQIRVAKLMEFGHEMCKNMPDDEAETIQHRLELLHLRYAELSDTADERMLVLQDAFSAAWEFSATHTTLSEWLSAVEEDLVQIDEVSICHQLELINNIESDTTEMRELMEKMATTGDKLNNFCSSEDAVTDCSCSLLEHLEELVATITCFDEAYKELDAWLTSEESEVECMHLLQDDGMHDIVEVNKRIWKNISDGYIMVEKLEKYRLEVKKLACAEDAARIAKLTSQLTSRYEDLKNTFKMRADVIERTQVHSGKVIYQLDGILESLNDCKERFNSICSRISDRPELLSRQIEENMALVKDLERKQSLCHSLINGIDCDDEVKMLSDKADLIELLSVELYNIITSHTYKLHETLRVAGSFWNLYAACMEKWKPIESQLSSSESATCEALCLVDMRDQLIRMKAQFSDKQASAEGCEKLGNQLLKLVGDEFKSNVVETVRQLKTTNQRITDLLNKRDQEIEYKLTKADSMTQLSDHILIMLKNVEDQINNFQDIGDQLEQLNEQFQEVLCLKDQLDAVTVLVEQLKQLCETFCSGSPVTDVSYARHAYETISSHLKLLYSIASSRHQDLEKALLQVGCAQVALDQMINWIEKTTGTVHELRCRPGDIKSVDLQLAVLRAVANDVAAHRATMAEVTDAVTRNRQFHPDQSSEQSSMVEKVEIMQSKWDALMASIDVKLSELEYSKQETFRFLDMFVEWQVWMSDVESAISNGRHVGGLPDTAKEQLEKFQQLLVQQHLLPGGSGSGGGFSVEHLVQALDQLSMFQGQLSALSADLDRIAAQGRQLREHAIAEEQQVIGDAVSAARDKWNGLNGALLERQARLEQSLLFNGQLEEAVDVLMVWLRQAEELLGDDERVGGDVDTLLELDERLQTLRSGLQSRESSIASIRDMRHECSSTNEQRQQQQQQLSDSIVEKVDVMLELWDTVSRLVDQRHAALCKSRADAERLKTDCGALFEWLAQAETRARPTEQNCERRIAALEHLIEEIDSKRGSVDEVLELGRRIRAVCHPKAEKPLERCLTALEARYAQTLQMVRQRLLRLKSDLDQEKQLDVDLKLLLDWVQKMQAKIDSLQDNLPSYTPGTADVLDEQHKKIVELIERQLMFEVSLQERQREVDEATADFRTVEAEQLGLVTPGAAASRPKNARTAQLVAAWRKLWLSCISYKNALNERLHYIIEMKQLSGFSFEDWRRRYVRWMAERKCRAVDLFKRYDCDGDGRLTCDQFRDAILNSRFKTTKAEMDLVVEAIDRNRDGFVDMTEFLHALRADSDHFTDDKRITEEIAKQLNLCSCKQKYRVEEVRPGRCYRLGERLKLVRIYRSTVMVRVGGGWQTFQEFMSKNDPCRAKGRTNLELREQFILPEGGSQAVWLFRRKNVKPEKAAKLSSGGTSYGPVTKIREKTERSMPMCSTGGAVAGNASVADNVCETSPAEPSSITACDAGDHSSSQANLPANTDASGVTSPLRSSEREINTAETSKRRKEQRTSSAAPSSLQPPSTSSSSHRKNNTTTGRGRRGGRGRKNF